MAGANCSGRPLAREDLRAEYADRAILRPVQIHHVQIHLAPRLSNQGPAGGACRDGGAGMRRLLDMEFNDVPSCHRTGPGADDVAIVRRLSGPARPRKAANSAESTSTAAQMSCSKPSKSNEGPRAVQKRGRQVGGGYAHPFILGASDE